MHIEPFFEPKSSTLSYVVYDPDTRDAVVIDPVLDYDPASSSTSTSSVDRIVGYAREKELTLHYIMETHAHADHLSGSQRLKACFPKAKTVIGAQITVVQKVFKSIFDLPTDFPTDGSQFDVLAREDQTLRAGTIVIETMFTPGHTPADVTYRIGDALFTGDALFMPDSGTGRCDFPAGSAEQLYDSVQGQIYREPDASRIFVGHDYQPDGRPVRFQTTVGESKRSNRHLRADTTREEFVRFRTERDRTLSAPELLFQSVQVNVDAGRLPKPADNEIRYLKIPINAFRPSSQGDVSLEPTPR